MNSETRIDYSCPVKSPPAGKSFENNSINSYWTAEECTGEALQKQTVDKYSPEQILKKKQEKQCKYFFESLKYINHLRHQETNIPKFNIQNFCYSNVSLSFHIIDSLENYDFVRKIKPSLNSTTKDSKAFIIDSDNERSFVLSKEATFTNYMEFINDFYSETLEKVQRNTFIDAKKKVPLIAFEELTTQSFKEVINREQENVSNFFAEVISILPK